MVFSIVDCRPCIIARPALYQKERTMSHTHLSQSKSRREWAASLRRSRPRKHARLRHRLLQAERLEDRRLLSGVSFADPALFDTGGPGSWRSVMADFSGDGKLDVAVTNWASNSAAIMFGDGQGHFGGATIYSTGSYKSSPLVAADFNHDGSVDLAAGIKRAGWASVSNDGQGLFGAPVIIRPEALPSTRWQLAT